MLTTSVGNSMPTPCVDTLSGAKSAAFFSGWAMRNAFRASS